MDLTKHQRHRMCGRKRKFSWKSALYNAGLTGLRPYECPLCRQWHLTKQMLPAPVQTDLLARNQTEENKGG